MSVPDYGLGKGASVPELVRPIPSSFHDISDQTGSNDDATIRASRNFTMAEYLGRLDDRWAFLENFGTWNANPSRIRLMRDLIMLAYRYALSMEDKGGRPSGHFNIESVRVVDRVPTVEIHESPHMLGESLEVARAMIVPVPRQLLDESKKDILDKNEAVINFASEVYKARSSRDLLLLYLHPFLLTELEQAHFLLDVALLGGLRPEMRACLRVCLYGDIDKMYDKLQNSATLNKKSMRRVPPGMTPKEKKVWQTSLEEALCRAKEVAHHFNEWCQTNQSFEKMMSMFLQEFSTLPYKVFSLLRGSDFHFFVLFLKNEDWN